MHSMIFQYLQTHPTLGYIAIFFAMIIEGDLFLFTAFFLVHQGYFNFSTMLTTVFTGTMAGDLFWYWLGMKLNHTPSKLNNWVQRLTEPFAGHLIKRPFHTIFFSKFVYGVHHAILIRAGSMQIVLKEFLRDDFLSSIFWIAIVGSLGFISSLSFSFVRYSIKFVELSLLIGVLVFYVIWHIVALRAKKEL
jgi:membrane protein DedA with SNARE-associated domain